VVGFDPVDLVTGNGIGSKVSNWSDTSEVLPLSLTTAMPLDYRSIAVRNH
jgi:hypothetical protein